MAGTTASFRLEWHGDQFGILFDTYADRFLREAGELVAHEAAENVHVKTGKLRQSVHYNVRSPKGLFYPPDAPSNDEGRMSPTTQDNTVKIGTKLFYGRFHEKKYGWLSRAADSVVGPLKALSETIAREVFQ